jgi:septal ring factor EnvC (AmiA/AmiB activator)
MATAAPAASVQTAVQGGCTLFKKMITNLENRLLGERRRLAALRAQLQTAQAKTNSDPDQIAGIELSISTLQSQIDEDEASLADIRVDFNMFCSGS